MYPFPPVEFPDFLNDGNFHPISLTFERKPWNFNFTANKSIQAAKLSRMLRHKPKTKDEQAPNTQNSLPKLFVKD